MQKLSKIQEIMLQSIVLKRSANLSYLIIKKTTISILLSSHQLKRVLRKIYKLRLIFLKTRIIFINLEKISIIILMFNQAFIVLKYHHKLRINKLSQSRGNILRSTMISESIITLNEIELINKATTVMQTISKKVKNQELKKRKETK